MRPKETGIISKAKAHVGWKDGKTGPNAQRDYAGLMRELAQKALVLAGFPIELVSV